MKKNEYTGNHDHPTGSYSVEFVAYEKKDGAWDVYLEEPEGSCPEFDNQRDKYGNVFLSNVDNIDKIDDIAEETANRLGPGYETIKFYRERTNRKITQKIWDYMKSKGCYGMFLSNDGVHWYLYIRRKDLEIASEVIQTNVESEQGH